MSTVKHQYNKTVLKQKFATEQAGQNKLVMYLAHTLQLPYLGKILVTYICCPLLCLFLYNAVDIFNIIISYLYNVIRSLIAFFM